MTLSIILQFLLGSIFLSVTLICFTFPGLALIKKFLSDLDKFEQFTIASIFGLVVFTLSAYILAALHLRFLMWLFPIYGIKYLIGFKNKLGLFKLEVSNKLFFLSVFVIGVIGMVAVNAPSGFPYKDGIYFWSSHGHDGIWHIALMEQMKNSVFPFQNPEFAGAKLQNYHFFVDLLMSEFSRMFHFSSLDIYFRFMPIVFAVLLGLGSFIFVKAWSKSEIAGIWAMIFTYFAGSFGYLLYIPTHKSLGGESIFWVSQTQSVLGNPPHASAFVIVSAFLFLLYKYFINRRLSYFVMCTILGGAVIEFKVYAGILLLGGLLFVGLYELLFKRIYQTILLFLSVFAVSFVIYFPNSANSQDFLLWQPWWFIRTMVVASDRLNWLDLELRRQTYVADHNWKRVIQLEATAFFIFLFGMLGMRFLGFWAIIKQVRRNLLNQFNLFFLFITIVSFFIPVFFLQKGVAWNTIQFNQYFLLFFGFWAAVSVEDILSIFKKKYLRIFISIIIIILAVPTQLGLLWQFYSNPPLSKVSYEEISALNYLKQQVSQNMIILSAPYNQYERDQYKNPPIPIYAWYDTGYVPAFSGKKTLISDEEQVNIMGYDHKKLIQERADAFVSPDYHKLNDFIRKYKIDYIYLVWKQKLATSSSYLNIDQVFQNKDATIYKVKQ